MSTQAFRVVLAGTKNASFVNVRGFNSSALLFAKKKAKAAKGGKNSTEEPLEVIDVKKYVKDATNQFEKTLELHKKKLAEKKIGTASPAIFNDLKVGKDGQKFTNVAATSLKGRNSLIVTVFDPKDTKNVVSAIMGAGMNLNPERIPNNDQQLKVSLPPITTETRQALCKDLKKVFEDYKHSAMKDSLGHIRSEIMKDLKHLEKKNDDVKKVIQDIEKVHKEYVNKLQEQLKQAEKSIMNQ
ncbi:ribosome-recycling factor [Kluyveromyces marxianus]|uniref:Ribosome-recycling factor, mitochondrial n=2 Tax=Kluyveromyces marxianus TaxID=4911 RepID=W0T7X0_KLUMD|nr:ribosome-recycling factor [Kluyveromyces marxianus DMKU3-1042]QGN15431.1 ribosome-recycling factor [Kluyveromyces marxianus]BAO39717.1 ribosome-recycling factor [Kluyveromyces marxianus DMKU3-1042]BAP71201.1 ribosome-recycling factor [Kluyveromyces marxianus]